MTRYLEEEDGHTEIRKLKAGFLVPLSQIIEQGEGWKTLMSIIPRDITDVNSPLKYTAEDMRLIEGAARVQERSCSEILFEEWGTSGRKEQRPTKLTLLEYLTKAKLYRAADFVASNLKLDPPKRPEEGPAAEIRIDEIISDIERTRNDQTFQVEISDENIADKENCVEFQVQCIYSTNNDETKLSIQSKDTKPYNSNSKRTVEISELTDKHDSIVIKIPNLDEPDSGENSSSVSTIDTVIDKKANNVNCYISQYPYESLEMATDNFSENKKIGNGAFGTVYFGKLNELDVAIKVLNVAQTTSDIFQQYRAELETLSQCNHENILPLLAISDDYVPCLIYRYMSNGSLEDRLACKMENKLPLSWNQRLIIVRGIVEGLQYLHIRQKPIIHCDIKSANVLLDTNDSAKIGDFGLVRRSVNGSKTMVTDTIKGTNAYMSPEALHGDVSVKNDIYSFGVVLLELLTGLSPYDENREGGYDLITYIEDFDDITVLYDLKADWDPNVAQHIYSLSELCLKKKKFRPNIEQVLNVVNDISNTI